MPMSPNTVGREHNKFVQSPTRTDGSAVEVVGNITTTPVDGPFSPPAGTDYIGRTVLSNVETFVFKMGGASGTVLKTITVTYALPDLEDLVSAEVV